MQETARQTKAGYYLKYLLKYTGLFAFATAGILVWFAASGKSLIWKQDALPQYIPNAYYFISWMREVVDNFVSGNFTVPLYDFSIGLGEAVQIHTEPLYWLYVLFSPEHVEAAFTFLFLLRFYLAGLSMSAFLLYMGRKTTPSLIASVVYLYSDFGLWGCFRHSQFVMALIMLPLCLIAMEEIVQKRRWYVCTVLMCLHMWVGYYFAYMNTFAMGVYFLLRFFSRKEGRSFWEFCLRMRTIVCSYLLGVLIGNFALVATFSSYLSSSRTESVEYGSVGQYLFYGWDWVKKILADFMTPGRSPGQWLKLGFLPLTVIAVAVIFLKKGKREIKGGFLACLACCLVPAAGFVFSGFSSINNRWCYMFAFVMAAALAFAWEDLQELSGKQQIAVLLVCAPFLAEYMREALLKSGETRFFGAGAALSLGISLAAVLLVNHGKRFRKVKRRLLLPAAAILTIWCGGFLEFSTYTTSFVKEFADRGKALELIEDSPLSAATDIEDDTFYRVDARRSTSNTQGLSKILGYNGTMNFSNTTSRTIQDFYRQMGISSWEVVRMKGFDGRTFLETLSGVKYFIIEQGETQDLPYGYEKVQETQKNGETYEIYENTMALPLGYTYSSVITEEELLSYDTASRPEVLLQAASVQELPEDQDETEDTEISVTGETAEIKTISAENLTYTENGVTAGTEDNTEKGTLTLTFEVPEDCEVSIYIKGLHWSGGGKSWIGYSCGHYSASYLIHGDEHVYYTKQEDHILNLGCHEAGTDTCTLIFDAGLEVTFDSLEIFCQPVEVQQDYTDALTEEVLENVTVSDNRVEGTISLAEDKLLVLTIPYGNGWTAYVDGEKTEIECANLMYSGIWLSAGEHEIVLIYHMTGAKTSLLLSAAGIAVFIAALMIRRKKRHAAQHYHSML